MKVRKDWAEAFAPYAHVLQKLKLPRRYKARDPRNIKRVAVVVEALHQLKECLRAKETKR